MAELKPCLCCGNYDISTYEEKCLFFSMSAFVKCNICGRTIKKRTLKQAIKAWNKTTERG